MARETHLADTYHRSIGSNGVAIASNWRLSASGTGLVVWSPESAGSVSYGSNATDVGSVNAAGASPLVTRADHVHRGVRTITSNGSNSLFGDINLVAGLGIALSVAGNTITISVTNQGGGGGGGGGGGIGTMPTFVAAGAMANSATVDIVPALPAGWQADDIFFLFCESSTGTGPPAPTGWAHVIGSPCHTPTGNGSTLAVFWRRAVAGDTAPTVAISGLNHLSGHVEAYRGCATTGLPYVLSGSNLKNTASTTMTLPAFATPIANSLIIIASSNGVDTATPQASGQANADLANIAERFDGFTSDGGGGGLSVMTGEKATAGAFGATTWTWAGSAADTAILIILRPATVTNPLPEVVAAGTHAASASGDIAPGLPTGWAEHDLFLLVCESDTGAPATPSGWTVAADSPQATTGSPSTLSVFYRRATSSESAPTVALGALNHLGGTIVAIRNVIRTGDPWNVTSGGNDEVADTAFSATGDTSTIDNCLVAVIGAEGGDFAGGQFSGWLNSSILPGEVFDNFTNLGGGGGAAMAVGTKVIAGTISSTTATLGSAVTKAFITLVLKPHIP